MSDSPGNEAVPVVAPVLKLIPGEGLHEDWRMSGDYDVDSIYLKSTDKLGHSENPRVKMPPHIYGQICAIVATGRTRYRTPADFIRDAAYHRLNYWHERLPDLDRTDFDIGEALAATERRMSTLQESEALVEATKALLEKALNDGANNALFTAISEAESIALRLTEPTYREQLLKLADEYRQKLNK